MTPTLFIDRDGTLLEEPSDYQVDRLDKIRLMPGVIPALLKLQHAGFRLVIITNQDGLGTSRFPQTAFQESHDFLMRLFNSQGIHFFETLICPHAAQQGCDCRKPNTRLADEYLKNHPMDAARSAVIGDRETDLLLAERLCITGYRIAPPSSEGTDWAHIVAQLIEPHRVAHVQRKTNETDVSVTVDLDKDTDSHIRTGLGFFDHMLEQVAKHSGIHLTLHCQGDLHIDEHHTVEDCALALGQALRQALGDKRGIARYGFLLAMDEASAQVALDLSGRSYFLFEGHFPREAVGGLPTELVPHFFRSLAESLGAALHLSVRGENTHHMVESCFKGVGRTLRQAIRLEGRSVPSSKGVL